MKAPVIANGTTTSSSSSRSCFFFFSFLFLEKNCFGTGVGICRLDTVHLYFKPNTSSKNVEENSTLQKDKTAWGRGAGRGGVGPARSNEAAQQPSLVSACALLLPFSGTLVVLSARCSCRTGPVLWCSTVRRQQQHRSADATEESTRRHTGKEIILSFRTKYAGY